MPIVSNEQIDKAIAQIRENILMAANRLRQPGAGGELNNLWVGEIVSYNQQIAELARLRNTGIADNLSLAARSWLAPLPSSVTAGT